MIDRIFALVAIGTDGNETLVAGDPGHADRHPLVWFQESTTAEYLACLPELAERFGKRMEVRQYTLSKICGPLAKDGRRRAPINH